MGSLKRNLMENIKVKYQIEKKIFVDKTLKFFIYLQTLATLFSILRGLLDHWYPVINLNLTLLAFSWMVYFNTHRIKASLKSLYITSFLQVGGIGTLLTFGTSSGQGMLFLITVVMVAVLFFARWPRLPLWI